MRSVNEGEMTYQGGEMPMFFAGEHEHVRSVVEAGSAFGYGNMIDRLKVAWMRHLVKSSGLSWGSAALAAGMDAERAESVAYAAKQNADSLLRWIADYLGETP